MEVGREKEDEGKNGSAANGHGELEAKNESLEKYSSRLWALLSSTERDYLLTSNDTKVKISELEGKVVGIYFSANWHPPCRKFNQLLASIYDQLKSLGSNFEVVFVSSDEDLSAFNEHRASMPWLSVPFSDLETRRSLSRMFNIEGIPSLVLLQSNKDKDKDEGDYHNVAALRDGVEVIYRYGIQAFPFSRERLGELQKEEKEREENQTLLSLLSSYHRDCLLTHPSLHQVSMASLEGKTIGLYFSAQWCLPCVKFTPKLVSIYQKMKQKLQVDFEIVFISSDLNQELFESYFRTMPWLAIPFADHTIKSLAKHFDVQVIPSLVILGPDGKTVTKQGRNLINLYQENAYPFTKERLELLERQRDEEAKNLPTFAFHLDHHHELNLVSQGPFICCACDEQGSCWTYQCLDCGYEVHPKCVQPIERPSIGLM